MRVTIESGTSGLQLHIEIRIPRWLQRIRLSGKAHPPKRVPGLLAGAFQVSDDFDDPLPEDFLIGGA